MEIRENESRGNLTWRRSLWREGEREMNEYGITLRLGDAVRCPLVVVAGERSTATTKLKSAAFHLASNLAPSPLHISLQTLFFIHPPVHTMSLFGSGSGSPAPKSGADVKSGIVQQLQQEAAMNNARLLIEVRHSLNSSPILSRICLIWD